MCNCIEETEKRIKREHRAALAQWEHFGNMRSQVRIVPLRKDGKPYRNSRYISVYWKFCPLCGREISMAPR